MSTISRDGGDSSGRRMESADEYATEMYGLIGLIRATPGNRDRLAEILINGAAEMPGCRSYVVAKDLEDPDTLWITEVWDSRESHQASLSLPAVQAAISEGRPLIEAFDRRYETEPLGGLGVA